MQSSRGLGNHGYGRLQAMHLLTVSVAMALTQSSDKMSCDWQLSKTSLAERIQFVLKSSHWSDCSFCVGREGNSQIFEAHKLILAASSPVFGAMCFGLLAEKNCINVPDLEPQIFNILLEYMYADSLKLKSVDEASGVLYASKKYMMPHLSCLCREYITNNIRPSNVLSIFEFAESIQETDLFYEPCVEVIIKHTEEVLHLSKGQMSGSFLTTILDQNSLNISELELFETALNWAYLECQEAGFQQTGSNCRAMLDRVGALSKIRFLSLTPEEFSKGPGQSGVLASDEIEALCLALCNIQNKNTSDPNIFDKDWPHSSNEELNCDRNNGNVVLLNTMLKSTLADKSCLPVNISKTLRRHGLSCVMRPRGRISVPQYYCARRFLKTAVTVSGNLRLLTKVHVSRSIVMTGLRFFTRLTPQREFTYSQSFPHDYRENIEVCVLDQLGEPLCNTIFSEKVVYNTLATLTLSEPVRFTGDKEYSIHVILPASTGLTFEYPLSFMSQTERSQDVEFRFCDHADINDNGTFVRRLDMGFLDTIVFSF
uniref:BTB domain-containing protein n=1 Tax=Timema bartmani TaxID=61472 RepID=A0A7R9I3B8_9NEOP|nr:unnamed protein product [Timema bartmani]